MIAVYSLWNMGSPDNTAAFNSVEDLMLTMKLSMLQSRKFFDRIIFVTDTIGAERAVQYDLPVDDMRVMFDDLSISPVFWAVPKLLALGAVNEPMMMHIDNDFIWWQDPTRFWGDADLFFQNVEYYHRYPFYSDGLEYLKHHQPHLYEYARHTDYAYNCGVTGVRSPAHAQLALQRAMELVETPDIVESFPTHAKYQINLILEQSFYGSMSEELGLKVHCALYDAYTPTQAFIHLLSTVKRKQDHMDQVRRRLKTMTS